MTMVVTIGKFLEIWIRSADMELLPLARLGYPPDMLIDMKGEALTKLHEIGAGQSARVCRLEGDARFLSRVTAIGLTQGSTVHVLQNARKRPVLVYLRDSSVAFDRGDCEHIEVEVLP